MKSSRFRVLFAGFLVVTVLVSSGWIWPLSLIFGEPKKKSDYHPRPKITVEDLQKKYGTPAYHRTYNKPVTGEMKFVKLAYDEEIAFEMGGNLVVYYFSKGKFLASALKNKEDASQPVIPEETAKPAPSDEAETPPAESTEPQEEEPNSSHVPEDF